MNFLYSEEKKLLDKNINYLRLAYLWIALNLSQPLYLNTIYFPIPLPQFSAPLPPIVFYVYSAEGVKKTVDMYFSQTDFLPKVLHALIKVQIGLNSNNY